jgi:hypothetical protein
VARSGWNFGQALDRFLRGRYSFLSRYARRGRLYSVAQFPDGKYGRVVGTVDAVDDSVMYAPVSGLPCIFYVVRIAEALTVQRKTGDPKVVVRSVSDAPFFLDDGTGRALVDPRGAIGFLDHPIAGGVCDRAPPPVVRLLQDAQRTASSRYTYAEWAIPVGTRVSVVGGGMREPDPDAAPRPEYRGEPPMRLRIAKTEPYALMISDFKDTFR